MRSIVKAAIEGKRQLIYCDSTRLLFKKFTVSADYLSFECYDSLCIRMLLTSTLGPCVLPEIDAPCEGIYLATAPSEYVYVLEYY